MNILLFAVTRKTPCHAAHTEKGGVCAAVYPVIDAKFVKKNNYLCFIIQEQG